MRKEAFASSFDVLTRYTPAETEENYDKPQEPRYEPETANHSTAKFGSYTTKSVVMIWHLFGTGKVVPAID
jgi:hypothetical protein